MNVIEENSLDKSLNRIFVGKPSSEKIGHICLLNVNAPTTAGFEECFHLWPECWPFCIMQNVTSLEEINKFFI